jgi:hypothetical protein
MIEDKPATMHKIIEMGIFRDYKQNGVYLIIN